MPRLRAALRQVPSPSTGLLLGCVVFGAVGAVIGLMVGLRAYPPTAWFAALEIGVPAGTVGGLLGWFLCLIPLVPRSDRARQRKR
jgi:hypothetical protein